MQQYHSCTLRAFAAGLLISAFFLPGCAGGPENGATVDVSGKVVRENGEPLSGANIQFTSPTSGATFTAPLSDEGTYEVELLHARAGEAFAVSFAPPEATEANTKVDAAGIPIPNSLPPMPERYTDPAATDLKATLGEESSQTFDFTLQSK